MSVTIVGNITKQPELRYTSGGAAVANFSVAVNKRKKVGEEWTDELVGFFDVSCWRDMAENVANLDKGTRVVVVGNLKQETWEQDGAKRSKVVIEAEDIGTSIKFAVRQQEAVGSW